MRTFQDDSGVHHEPLFENCKPMQGMGSLNLGMGLLNLSNSQALTYNLTEPKPTTSVNPLEVFDEAPGRLCLLNASTKYKVC